MPIDINTIRRAAFQTPARPPHSSAEAKILGYKTAFLCHSHHDKDLVVGVVRFLQASGWRVYVDWADQSMPDSPNKDTAHKIKVKIVDHNLFLFLATKNSMSSRWCPWELGYADGKKSYDQILLIPTSDGYTTYGNEYIDIYRRIDATLNGVLAVFEPGLNNSNMPIRNL